jgi:peptidyl-prolyl cis-trans isomerase D
MEAEFLPMLDIMRRQKRLKMILWVVIAGLALGMLLFFVPTMDQGALETSTTIASVDGKDISAKAFSSFYVRTVERISQGSNRRIDAETLKAMGVPNQILEDMITAEVIQLLAKRLGIEVTQGEVSKAIEANPNFQDNGQFIGVERYKALLALNNYSITDFENDIHRSLLVEKVQGLITSSLDVADSEVQNEFSKTNQKTQVDYVLLKTDDFKKRVKPNPAELQAYFNTHKDSYRIKEKRRAQCLLIPISSFLPSINVTDQEIKAEWNAQPHGETVEASHILFMVKDPAQDAAVKQKAETILKLVKSGGDFADLAKKHSEDTGSASKGGYLGPFQKGQGMVKEFEQAAFSLKPGETSGLVHTEYGYHIIKVLKHELPTLESSKVGLTAAILQKKAQNLAKQKAEETASIAKQQKDLNAAAKKLGMVAEIKETGFFQKEDNPTEFGISQALRDEIFELKELNSIGKPVEYPMGFAIPKLAEVQLPRPGTLVEFHAQAEKDYIDAKAKELAQAEANKISAEAIKLASIEKAAKAAGVSVKKSQEFNITGTPDPEIGANTPFNKVAFDLQPGAVSEPQSILDNFAVFQVKSRSPFDEAAFQKRKPELRKQMLESLRNPYFQEYLRKTKEELEKAGKIRKNAKALDKAASRY